MSYRSPVVSAPTEQPPPAQELLLPLLPLLLLLLLLVAERTAVQQSHHLLSSSYLLMIFVPTDHTQTLNTHTMHLSAGNLGDSSRLLCLIFALTENIRS